MLGYASSRGNCWGVNLASDFIQDPERRAQLLGRPGQQGSVHPLEIEWKRKDGTILKVRLNGHEVMGEPGEAGHL